MNRFIVSDLYSHNILINESEINSLIEIITKSENYFDPFMLGRCFTAMQDYQWSVVSRTVMMKWLKTLAREDFNGIYKKVEEVYRSD